jgi:thiol-disulfide isomerase/thioredoxin
MGKKGKKRQWYLDAALVAIILVLIVLIVLALKPPAEDPVSGQATEEPLGGYTESTPQTLALEEQDEKEADPALDFEREALSGEIVSLSDYRGKPVLINFWATWCPPCVQEMPVIQAAANQYEDELVVLAVNGGESVEQIGAFAEAFGYTLTFLLDPETSLANLYGVRGFPTTFFIDPEGLVQGTYIGMMDENIIAYYLEKIGVSE